jgi:hypothetical protein
MSQDQAKQFIEQASQSLQSGQVEQALALIEQALALNDRDSEAHILRGICLAQTNRPQEAGDAFKHAIGLSPYNAKAYYNLAVHYYSLGQKHEALNMANEAVGVDPRHSSAKELVARINAEMRAVSQAGPGINQGVTPPPTNPADALGGMSTPPQQSPQAPMAPPQGGMTPPPGSMAPPSGMGQPQQPAPTPPGGVIEPQRPVQQPGQMPPPGGPYPPQGPGQYPQGAPYMRPGYESGPQHSLEFVEKMGGKWVAIAWTIVAAWWGSIALSLIMDGPRIMAAMQAATSGGAPSPESMAGGNPILNILGYAVLFGAWIWMILDTIDRKGNWLWFVGMVICCCCGFIILPIYLLAGRK